MKISVGLYPNQPADQLLRSGELADRLGYDTLWVADSHLLWREVYGVLGAIAARTKRIKLASAVTNVVTRHLTVTASAFCTLSELSNGRAIIGISVGDSALATMGLRPVTVDAFAKALGNLRLLINGDPVRIPEGEDARIAYAERTNIPIYVAATGPRMLRLAGQLADGVILMNGIVPELVEAAVAIVHAGTREAGRNPDAVKIVVWAACHSRRGDPRTSLAAVKYNVARAILRNIPGPIDDLTRATAERVRSCYNYAQHGDARADFAQLIPDELVPRFAFAGTPEDVRAQISALEPIGVDEVALAIPSAPEFGSRDEVIELLAPSHV
ncbi:MAG TPA: LLM class flavin-dependent oxidoreductase [Alphaproteobacteria bacterium]|nr:LLM class flavin-dependent oxidoreductase [Alphaproteobacteria bacterium]